MVRLTGREQAVLALLALAMMDKEIAWYLCIAEHTVGQHVAAIMHKTGVHKRLPLGMAAWRHREWFDDAHNN